MCTRSWEGAEPGELTQPGQRAIPYLMTACSVYELGGVGRGAAIAAQGLAGHQSVGGEQLHCALLILYILLSLLLLILLVLLLFLLLLLFSLPFLSS